MPITLLSDFLDRHGVKYVIVSHSKAYTASEVAASVQMPGKEMASAGAHYRQFLRRYDSPMPSQQHLVDEARAAVARLSGREEPRESR